MNVGGAEEYKDLSKDGSGAWRKAKKGHKGQIVYSDKAGKVRVRPVYAFESIATVNRELESIGAAVVDFFQSGCPVVLSTAVEHPSTPLKADSYTLTTIFADGRARLTNASGNQSLPIALSKLLAAGLKRLSAT